MSVIKSTKQPNNVLVSTYREACEIDITKIDCLTIAEPSRQLVIEYSTVHPDIYVNYPEGAEGIAQMFADLEALAKLRMEYLGASANSVYSSESDPAVPYYIVLTPHVYGEVLLNGVVSVQKVDDQVVSLGYVDGEGTGNTYYYQVGRDRQHECFLALREVVFAEYPEGGAQQDYRFKPQ